MTWGDFLIFWELVQIQIGSRFPCKGPGLCVVRHLCQRSYGLISWNRLVLVFLMPMVWWGYGREKAAWTVSEVLNEPAKVRWPQTVPAKVERYCWMLRSTEHRERQRWRLWVTGFWTGIGCEILLQQSWRQDCVYWEQLGQYFTDDFWMAGLPNYFRWVNRRNQILSLHNISNACGIVLIKFLNSLLKAEVLLHVCHNQNSASSKNIIPPALIS